MTKKLITSAGPLLLAGALALAGCKGDAGKNGVAGTSCSVQANYPAAGESTITCTDGSSATVANGAPGDPGNPGVSCSVAPSGADALVTCGATQVTLAHGADGVSCSMQTDTPAVGQSTITCGTSSTVVANGTDGSSCTVAANTPVAGQSTLTCTDGTTAVVNDGAPGQGCTVANNGDGTSTITCGLSTSIVSDGSSCTVASSGGVSTLTCTDGTSATLTDNSCAITTNPDMTRTIVCTGGTAVTFRDTTVDFALLSAAEQADLNMSGAVSAASVPADGRPVVTFKVSDRKGNGVRNLPLSAFRLAVLQSTQGVNGSANATWVNYNASATGTAPVSQRTASTETGGASNLTDNKDGTYTFRMTRTVNDGVVTYDASAVQRFVAILSSSGNPYAPVNVVGDFVPASGPVAVSADEKADEAACLECHGTFRAPPNGTAAFHSGARYALGTCSACHNDQRRFTALPGTGSTPTVDDSAVQPDGTWTGNLAIVNGEAYINLPVFIHKIHMGEELALRGGTYPGFATPYEVTYPQSITMCAKCHRAPAAQAANWASQPSRRACGACHDATSFLDTPPNARTQHPGGACASDTDCGGDSCTACHDGAGIQQVHFKVTPPDPANVYAGGTQTRTNAACLVSAATPPAGAAIITYDIQSVSRDASKHPVIVFRLKKDGTPVVFDAYQAGVTEELMSGFVGAPAIYFAFAVPQDGIAAPADFNVSANVYLKKAWKDTAGGTTTNNLTFDAGTGYYTLTKNDVVVPDEATMLTGGIGYNYDLGSLAAPVQPLTQVDTSMLPGDWASTCAYDPANRNGGLLLPVTNTWKVAAAGSTAADGKYAARRTVVANANCNKCHAALGVNPTFHVGQRNDAPTCSFCHNPNRTSSGWSANAKDFIHGIHAAGKRTVPYTWHEVSPTDGFWQVTYPGVLNKCEQCHASGQYYFTTSEESSLVPNLLPSTVATGVLSASAANSPWITVGADYGAGFGFTASTGVSTQPAAANLVVSPITAACSACHDSAQALWHMKANSGTFYAPLGSLTPEYCLMCHGQGKVAAIDAVHAQ